MEDVSLEHILMQYYASIRLVVIPNWGISPLLGDGKGKFDTKGRCSKSRGWS